MDPVQPPLPAPLAPPLAPLAPPPAPLAPPHYEPPETYVPQPPPPYEAVDPLTQTRVIVVEEEDVRWDCKETCPLCCFPFCLPVCCCTVVSMP
ncbi:hypothetical protein LSAT2_003022 [Lamellibrachia satsuma]|nr:hypothetical protein LSAT2_003022 [Lamellibrachia satsuma]